MVKNTFLALLFILILFSAAVFGDDYTIEWVDTLKPWSEHDWAEDVVLDGNGNIIILAYSYINDKACQLIIKYNSAGTIIKIDTTYGYEPKAIAMDSNGNIVVTGYISSSAFYTAKYNSSFTLIWADTVRGGYLNCSEEIAIDKNNNIIVTGGYLRSLTDTSGYHTLKYNPAGNIIWADTLKNNEVSWAYGVATDKYNNIIVTGASGTSDYTDYYTVKYNPSGEIIWSDTVEDGNKAYAVGVDSNNNFVVTGTGYYTVKYSSSGAVKWAKTIGSGGSKAKGVTTNYKGDIIITGSTGTGSSIFDKCYTVKCDSNGSVLWSHNFSGASGGGIRGGCGNGVAVDKNDNIIVVGRLVRDDKSECFVIKYKYSPSGVMTETSMKPSVKFEIWPNPFSRTTVIRYESCVVGHASASKHTTQNAQHMTLRIYDLTGRLVKSFPLLDSRYSILNSVTWDGSDESGNRLPSGIYFCKLFTESCGQAGENSITKQLFLLR
ncbi:MAG: FlgD immunoglobulin-like domain containing protein [bacterium]|nr:FlgD immunoglobulin-like domain containing protein [bacterium]